MTPDPRTHSGGAVFDARTPRSGRRFGQAAETCAKAVNIGKAIEIALDIEQLTYEVNTLLAGLSVVASRLEGADGARIAGFVSGVVMLYQGDDVWTYAMHRFIETVVGIAVAWSVSRIPKLIKTGEEAE